jgi:hypothetical protein
MHEIHTDDWLIKQKQVIRKRLQLDIDHDLVRLAYQRVPEQLSLSAEDMLPIASQYAKNSADNNR